MAEIKLKKREEMDPAYCWDLSSLFGSDEEFEKTEQELAKKIEAFRAKQGTMKESAEALYDVLSGLDDISRVFSSLYVYASQKYHQDMGNQKYQGYAGKMDSMMAVLADASSFVEPEILELDEETVTEFEKAYEPLRLYDRILKENFRKKEHILSPEMEAVLAKAGEMASSPDQIFSAFSNADLRFQPVTDEEENQVPLSHGTFVGFLQSKDRRVRKEAFEKYYAEYEKHKNMLAATFGANLKQAAFFADVRKYPSALAASLDGGNIPVSVYDKLLEAIHAKMPAMYRYVALRKKLLGVDELHMYDVYVSLTKEYEQKYTYEQAIEIVKKALAVLGDDYVALLDKGFSERWVDVYENEGKKSGAYSWGSYDSHPYVLMSFNGNIDSVFTLAHEMGHSLHTWYSNHTQPFTYAEYRLFVAEVASTCNEALLIRYLLKHAKEKEEKIFLLNYFLDQFKGTRYADGGRHFRAVSVDQQGVLRAGYGFGSADCTGVGENSAFLYTILCISVCNRFFGGYCNQQQDSGRGAGYREEVQTVLKRRLLDGSDRPFEDLRRRYDEAGAGGRGAGCVCFLCGGVGEADRGSVSTGFKVA